MAELVAHLKNFEHGFRFHAVRPISHECMVRMKERGRVQKKSNEDYSCQELAARTDRMFVTVTDITDSLDNLQLERRSS